MAPATHLYPLMIVGALALAALVAAPAKAGTPLAAQCAPSADSPYLWSQLESGLFPAEGDSATAPDDILTNIPSVPVLPVDYRSTGWRALTYTAREQNAQFRGRPYLGAGFTHPWQDGLNPMLPLDATPFTRTGGLPYRRAGYPLPSQLGVFYRSPW